MKRNVRQLTLLNTVFRKYHSLALYFSLFNAQTTRNVLQTCQSAQVLKCVLQGTSCARMEPVYQDKLRVICANLCQPASSRVISTSAVQTESLVLMIFQNVQLRKLALIPGDPGINNWAKTFHGMIVKFLIGDNGLSESSNCEFSCSIE